MLFFALFLLFFRLGGFFLLRLRLSTAVIAFGVLQLVSNLGFYLLAHEGAGAWGTALANACARAGECATLVLWERLSRAINETVDGMTLADLAEIQRAKAGNDYVI